MLQSSRRTLTKYGQFYLRHPLPSCSRRTFALTASHLTALPLHSSDVFGVHPSIAHADRSPSASDDYLLVTRRHKYNTLLDCLDQPKTSYDQVWAAYVDLLEFTRDERLSLELHQRILRKCSPDVREIRANYAKRLRERRVTSKETPHRYEARFLSVINNIRSAGHATALEDYEFILCHFAAVGHYVGATQVLEELVKEGVEPRTKTYGLCLQAIAYRLTLPIPVSDKVELREQCCQLGLHIVNLVRQRKQKVLPSACLDLILRIMKDSENEKVFTSLLKIAYGIDLEFLDRHALASDGCVQNPEPFSTAALTTLIDFLGRQERVSKMICAFEVLSTPLKVNPSQLQSRNFNDDDDDDYFVPLSVPDARPFPSARPNITTYNTLIRHCTHLGQNALAKHYVLQALELDYSESARFQIDIQTDPVENIVPPDTLVNVDTFRPILGLANRNNDLGLIRWVLPHFRLAWRRKKQDLEYYSAILDHPEANIPQPAYPRSQGGLRDEYELAGSATSSPRPSQDTFFANPSHPSHPVPIPFFAPSSSSAPLHPTPALFNEEKPHNPLDIDLEPSSPSAGNRPKSFDLAIHVQVLKRDVQTMKELDGRFGAAISRLSIRRKEALGRRIWQGKNVFLRSDDKRVEVTREQWMDIVNFGGSRSKAVSTPSTPSTSAPEIREDPIVSLSSDQSISDPRS